MTVAAAEIIVKERNSKDFSFYFICLRFICLRPMIVLLRRPLILYR